MTENLKVVLCEKPSVARDIARFLNANKKHEGYLEGNGWAVTWAFGHLLELKDPNEYRDEWKAWKVETLPMIPDVFELKPRGDKGAREQLSTIKKLLKSSSEIICATDAGREGELIFRYIQEHAGVLKKPFKRLWVSSLTNEALALGFERLKPGSDFNPLFEAARCRSEADWIVGLNATRFFTVLHGGGEGQLWSVGRVQTPVLAMVVERDSDIRNFKVSDYWELHTHFKNALFKWEGGKIESQPSAQKLLDKIQNQRLEILDRQEKEESVKQPFLYDLTDLQKDMNRRFSMSADQTLKTAQSLYEKKLITYPRTDSKFLTQDIAKELPSLFEKLRHLKPEEITRIDLSRLDLSSRVVNDLKVTDHHALIPTGIAPHGMSQDESTVYHSILMRLIAVFYPPGKKQVLSIKARILDEEFKASGSVTVDPGWQSLFPKATKKGATNKDEHSSDEGSPTQLKALLEIFKGDSGEHEPLIKTLQTKPPIAYNEASLLQMMESAGKQVSDEDLKAALKDKGLGTPATRASIIETLLSRGYLVREKKVLVSTALGQKLISFVNDHRLKSPELTGEWESRLKQIENSSFDPRVFMEDVKQYTREIIGLKTGEKGLGPCPLCGSEVIEGKKGYGCSDWNKGCKFVLWKQYEGALIDTSTIAQLLRLKKCTRPICISRENKKQWGLLTMSSEGTLSWEVSSTAPDSSMNSSSSEKAIGQCPRCSGHIIETPKAYGCEHWRSGCSFAIWKSIAKKKISLKIAKELLTQGKTSEVLTGFKSKKGASFSARLVILNQEVKFEFDNSSTSKKEST